MAFGFIDKGLQWFGDRVSAEIDKRIEAKQRQAGAAWLAKSRALAPERTGYLKAQEGYEVKGRDLTLIMGANYDVFTEMGTRWMGAIPHVRPALNEVSIAWGGRVVMEWNIAPIKSQPIIYQAGRYHVPRTLTRRQREHVRRNLAPVARRLHRGNVRRAGFRIRRVP